MHQDVPWISGYLEFTIGADGATRRLQATQTVNPEFHVSLTQMQRVANFPMWYSQVQAWSTELFYIADYLTDVNVAIAGNSRQGPTSRWYGAKPFDVKVFQATLGLLGFASFVQLCVWLAMVVLSYDAPGAASNPAMVPFTKFGSLVAAFFTTVALIYFDSSGYKTEMCSAYDPDATTNGKGCGYGAGYNLAIVATIFSIAQVLAMYYLVPEAKPSYAFNASASKPMAGYSEVGAGSSGFSGISSSDVPQTGSFQASTAL